MATTEGCCGDGSLPCGWSKRLLKFLNHLVNHDLRANRALMGKIETEINRGFSNFSFQVTCLSNGILHKWN